MGRRQIDALINADPIGVRFRRREKVQTTSGGWTLGPEQILAAQEITLIPFKRRMTEFLIDTQEGNIADLPYVLVGRYTLNIQEGDRFTVNGEEFRVETIDVKREIRIAAHVDYFREA